MSQWINKQFKNNATTPIIVQVSALADGLPFAPIQLGDRITQIVATGGTLMHTDDGRAEAHRMRRWIEHHFIGKSAAEFYAHNGTVPSAEDTDEQHLAKKRIDLPPVNIVNTVTLGEHNDAAKAEEAIARILKAERRPKFYSATGLVDALDIGARDRRFHALRSFADAGEKAAAAAPQPGTYWQDRERPVRFFIVSEKRACIGHAHVRMIRVDGSNDGVFDFPYENNAQWDKMFKQVRREDVPSLRNSYDDLAEMYRGVPYIPAKERTVGMPPELGMGYRHAANVGKTDSLLDTIFRSFLDSVEMSGAELPPQPGERYYSLISHKTYTVIDVRPKGHATQEHGEYTVTMERDGDEHRAKYTYRDHASWLTTWRPLDDEDQPRKIVEVELRVDASEAMRQVGEAAHEAAEAMMDFRETDAERQLRILYNELERRRPGWRNMGFHFENIDDLGLAIRAIRAIAREGREVEALKEQNKAQLAMTEVKNKKIAKLEGELAELRKEYSRSWGPDRIRTEQDRMREMLFEFTRLFKHTHGVERTRIHMKAFNIKQMIDTPLEIYLDFMRDCRAYAEKHMP